MDKSAENYYVRNMFSKVLGTATSMKFQFNEEKAIEALVWLGHEWPGVTMFYVSKVLFYAEKFHLNKYGRPVVADTFIAMANGPVPSTIYDLVKGNYMMAERPDELRSAIEVRYPGITSLRPTRLDVFSQSDIECLREAVEFCRHRPFGALSNMTHQERAWSDAPPNAAMDYEAFIDDDNPRRDALIEAAHVAAAYGVL